jgi:hypothetical protein
MEETRGKFYLCQKGREGLAVKGRLERVVEKGRREEKGRKE